MTEGRLPAQSCYEAFAERLANGTLCAESPSLVVSLAEEEEQERLMLEPTQQYGIELDSKLAITTKRRCVNAEARDRGAIRLCTEDGMEVGGAPWAAFADKEHRMDKCVQIKSIASSCKGFFWRCT